MKIFCPLGAYLFLPVELNVKLENCEIILSACPRNTFRISRSDSLMQAKCSRRSVALVYRSTSKMLLRNRK
jgi:hypothetical protein